MSKVGYHNRGISVSTQIYSLFSYLDAQTYDEIAPKIEYWTELAFTQQLTTVDNLVERVSLLAWSSHRSPKSFARFLKYLRDSPHGSAQARSFVEQLCTRAFLWFAVASTEDLEMDRNSRPGAVTWGGGEAFVEVAAFVGHLIECNLLDRDLVRLHLIKPLTTHYYPSPGEAAEIVRANAICRLFAVTGNTLVQGLLEPEDVRVCFEILGTKWSRPGGIAELSTVKLEELRGLHTTWLQQNDEQSQNDIAGAEGNEEEGGGEAATEIPVEVETPVAFAPQDLPTTTNIGVSPPTLRGIESSSDGFDDNRTTTASSPTLSISTISDLVPTESDEDIVEGSGEQMLTRHETFYLEDGNVEIVCGHKIFRIHSSVVLFSSPKLRDMLSPPTLLGAPMPKGCPRVVFKDSAEDFAVLLKMIYTPGFPARNKVLGFSVFASLLRMATKYGFSDVRKALAEDLKSAYPTKLEDHERTKVLGEDFFGLPKPHPNAVLNLFTEHNVKFALPFAAYRAGLGGPSVLASERPGTALPRLTLASIIHGIGGMRRTVVYAAATAYTYDLATCLEKGCILNTPGGRVEVWKKIFIVMARKSQGDMLSPLSFENLCTGCAKFFKDHHRDCCKRFVWAELPGLIGLESWEGI